MYLKIISLTFPCSLVYHSVGRYKCWRPLAQNITCIILASNAKTNNSDFPAYCQTNNSDFVLTFQVKQFNFCWLFQGCITTLHRVIGRVTASPVSPRLRTQPRPEQEDLALRPSGRLRRPPSASESKLRVFLININEVGFRDWRREGALIARAF